METVERMRLRHEQEDHIHIDEDRKDTKTDVAVEEKNNVASTRCRDGNDSKSVTCGSELWTQLYLHRTATGETEEIDDSIATALCDRHDGYETSIASKSDTTATVMEIDRNSSSSSVIHTRVSLIDDADIFRILLWTPPGSRFSAHAKIAL